jgi:sucrose phosphorylase
MSHPTQPAPRGVQLIAAADRFGGDLPTLKEALDTYFEGVFEGVHILPFFTSHDGPDAEFSPVDHTAIDPRLGTWDDVRAISAGRQVMADVIVNHISAEAAVFQDVVACGDESPYAELFLTLSTVFPEGATEQDLADIRRPRPGLPFTPYTLGGQRRLLWTTFGPGEIDIDTEVASGQTYLLAVLDQLAAAGVATVRLDGVGYAAKQAGTTCFMIPESYALIDWLTAEAHARGLTVVVELHAHDDRRLDIASRVDLVHDFALSPLILHAFRCGDVEPLRRWLEIRPANAVTVLDSATGVGFLDVGPDPVHGTPGLLEPDAVAALVSAIDQAAGVPAGAAGATNAGASELGPERTGPSYASVVGSDYAYIAARAIQFFTPGIPQVYYVGAVTGATALDPGDSQGGRDLDRHIYTIDEIAAAVERPVIRALSALARFRNRHPAFAGDFSLSGGPGVLELLWRSPDAWARLTVEPSVSRAVLDWGRPGATWRTDDLLADPPLAG